jgi:FKBP-type peptidyl-prolyl cis-trans isomerase
MAVDITRKKDGGILKEILTEGTGDATPTIGSHVTIHYVGTFMNGKIFDSTRNIFQPFTFELGLKQVISGLDIAIATMKKGEIATFTIDPKYAYQGYSNEIIPAHSTLKFEVNFYFYFIINITCYFKWYIYQLKYIQNISFLIFLVMIILK